MVELISRSEDKSLAHIQPVLFDSLRYFRWTVGFFLLPVQLSCIPFNRDKRNHFVNGWHESNPKDDFNLQ